jgi:hypothetical protein
MARTKNKKALKPLKSEAPVEVVMSEPPPKKTITPKITISDRDLHNTVHPGNIYSQQVVMGIGCLTYEEVDELVACGSLKRSHSVNCFTGKDIHAWVTANRI